MRVGSVKESRIIPALKYFSDINLRAKVLLLVLRCRESSRLLKPFQQIVHLAKSFASSSLKMRLLRNDETAGLFVRACKKIFGKLNCGAKSQ